MRNRLGLSESDVILAIELVLLIEGNRLGELRDDCTSTYILKLISILLVQFVQKVVHDITGLLL